MGVPSTPRTTRLRAPSTRRATTPPRTAPQTGEDRAYIFNVPLRFEESIYSLLDATYNVGFTSLDGGVD
jgi:hypothetical protein